LNFIYGTDSYLDGPSSIAESMHNIVTECCHHMDMDAAAILAPSQNIWTSHQEDSGEPKDRQDRLREFSEQVLRQVISTGQTKQLKQLLPAGEAMAGQVSVIVSPIKSRQGNPVGLFALFRRAEKKKFSLSEEKVGEVLATRIGKYMLMGLDPLTGILDRIGFEEQVATILARPAEGRGLCTLAKIDIDGFALVNDTYSVSGGDQVLKQLARLIKDYIWVDDVVARTGGDEFCIILHGAGLGQGSVIIERLRRKIAKAFFAYDNRLISISASIGLFAVHDCGGNLTEIDSALDVACQNAKENGGNRVQVYSGNNLELRRRRSEISFAAMIDDAIEEERFELYCQPLVPLWGANFHYEILLRLNNENGDIIPPDDFMGAAERYNRLPGIDRWVVAKAFKMLGEAAKKLEGLELCWGINLTGQSLAEESFRHFVEEQIRAIEFPAKWVYFEITESVAIRNIEQVTDFVSRIKGLGCDFALDDFGTGYSSYGYLKNLPVKCLKIDGSFIRNLNNDPFNQLAVQSINQLAHYLGLQTVAEYVETEEVAQLLRKIGIDYAQGYSYGKPQPLRQVLAAL
jgi:diguanylate cyclase (GGDEF)-like protein